MKRKQNKGFTLVELLVVISIVAVLSTVSVVGYMAFRDKANKSNDDSLVSQMNTALQADEVLNGKPKHPTAALEVLAENGILLDKVKPAQKDYSYLWDSASNRVVLVDAEMKVSAPSNFTLDEAHKENYFTFIGSPEDRAKFQVSGQDVFSYYLTDGFTASAFEASTGFDVGNNPITTAKYTNTSGTAKSVVLRTNGGSLTVNAPLDVVKHYDGVDNVVIDAIASESYHETGKVNISLEVNDGHVVVEEGAEIEEVKVPESANSTTSVEVADNSTVTNIVVESNTASVDVSEKASVDTVVAPQTNENVKVPEATGATKQEKTVVTDASSLKDALVNGKKYIEFAKDITAGAWSSSDSVGMSITKDAVIDGKGFKFSTSASRGAWIDANNVAATFKNLELEVNGLDSYNASRGIQVNNNIKGAKLKLDNVNISKVSHYGINIANGAEVDLLITNSHIKAWGALNLWSANYNVRVDNSILEGINDKGYNASGWNNFGTVVLEGDTTNKTEDHSSMVDVEINNSEIIANSTTGNKQAGILFNNKSMGNRVSLKNTKFTLGETKCYRICDDGNKNEVLIDGNVLNPNVDVSKITLNTDNLVFAEDGKTATGKIVINIEGKNHTVNLADVIAVPWEKGTDYLFEIELEKELVRFDLDVSSEYGAEKCCLYAGLYIK